MRQRLWCWFYHRLVGLLHWAWRHTPDHPVDATMEMLNREYYCVETLKQGAYKYQIFFNGWIGAQEHSRLIGVWLAYPMEPEPRKVTDTWDHLPYLVVGVGVRAHGQYDPGETWDIRVDSLLTRGITKERLQDPRRVVEARKLWKAAHRDIRTLARQAIAHKVDAAKPSVPIQGWGGQEARIDQATGEFFAPVGKWTHAAEKETIC